MEYKLITWSILGLLLTGCGSSNSSSQNEEALNTSINITDNREESMESEKQMIAIDNAGNKVISKFNGFKVMVYTDKVLTKETSHATKPVYGHINEESTLLSINDNYEDGDVFIVKVFDGDEIVGESDEIVLDGDVLEFEDIKI